jgi:renalase
MFCNGNCYFNTYYFGDLRVTNIAIIGAGLSGLTAADMLKKHADITIFEKSRGVSGRMSTRRAEPYFFDHGAQYFTASTIPFQNFIQPMVDNGVIQRWNARYIKFDEKKIIEREDWAQAEPRYVGVPGMNAVGKYLASDLDIKLNTRIINLQKNTKWNLKDEQGNLFEDYDWVISTAPAAQTAVLCPENFQYLDVVKDVQMRACFSLMLGFIEHLPLDFEVAHITNSDLAWLAVNSHKPGRNGHYTLLATSSEDYADAHIDDDRDEVIRYLCAETSRIIDYDVAVAAIKTVHGWRYAHNANKEKLPVLIDHNLQLAVCGDWCVGGRVEAAFTAANNLVEKIIECINQ